MLNWNNLDTLASYQELEKAERINLAEVMSGENGAERVKTYSTPIVDGLTFNYAAKAVDDNVLAILDKLAKEGNKEAIHFPRAFMEDAPYDFSFSGLKSAVLNYLNGCEMKHQEINRADVAASFQQAVVDVLTDNSVRAAKAYGCKKLALAGGVASNSSLRENMQRVASEQGLQFYYPSPIFCTDNAAMIGVAGYHNYMSGIRDGLDLNAIPNLKIGERR